MDFTEGDPVREKFLRMGRKFRWFDMPLEEKIDALKKEIKMGEEITCKKSNGDLVITDNRQGVVLDADNPLTTSDIVNISDHENDDDIDNGVESNGKSHVDNTGNSIDSGDNNITNSDVISSVDNEDNNDGDDIIEDSDDGGNDVSKDENADDDSDVDSVDNGSDGSFIDDSNESKDNVVTNSDVIGSVENEDNDGDDIEDNDDGDNENDDDDRVDSGDNGSDDSFIDDSNESKDNYVDSDGDNDDGDIKENHAYEPDSMAMSSEVNKECPSFIEHGIQPNIWKDEDQVTHDKEEIDEFNLVEEFESVHNIDEHSFKAPDFETSNTKLFNIEMIESTTDGTEISEESQFVEPCSYSYSKDRSTDSHSNICEDGSCGDDDDDEESLKYKNNEDDQDVVTTPLVNSIKINDGCDLSTEELFMRAASGMTDCSDNNRNSISDSPDIPASLSARLFKKYNPEKSESDVDDFELFLQKIRTPKKTSLSEEDKKAELKRLDEFIVNDGDEDLEEDVFMDPGFQEEFDFDSDKENDDCIEITSSVASYTPFKTPADFSWKTPKSAKTKLGHTGLSSGNKLSRPKSVLKDLLTPYSTEKGFKTNREQLAKDLFELYNRTVFDNQLPSDFQITWNKKMRSTAGFCYYSRKNGLRMSRIELADKVIDSADRLRDTLIHEMCHAASWVISDVKAGHGPVWKKWTRRANFVHQDLPPISRCHSYTINTKYTYRCTKCENTFGRHSKSVNLEKSRCAYCHSRLELVPQLKKDGTPQTRIPSRFAMFVKENFARIKKDNETFSHQEVMKALSSEFTKLST